MHVGITTAIAVIDSDRRRGVTHTGIGIRRVSSGSGMLIGRMRLGRHRGAHYPSAGMLHGHSADVVTAVHLDRFQFSASD